MKYESACARSHQLSRSAKHGATEPRGWGPAAMMKERARRAAVRSELASVGQRANEE